jgi:hypothetical protein
MKWYLAALIVVPAFFVLDELRVKRTDPWMAQHRLALYSACALFAAAMLVARGMTSVQRVGDWLIMASFALCAVLFAVRAVRSRQAAE